MIVKSVQRTRSVKEVDNILEKDTSCPPTLCSNESGDSAITLARSNKVDFKSPRKIFSRMKSHKSSRSNKSNKLEQSGESRDEIENQHEEGCNTNDLLGTNDGLTLHNERISQSESTASILNSSNKLEIKSPRQILAKLKSPMSMRSRRMNLSEQGEGSSRDINLGFQEGIDENEFDGNKNEDNSKSSSFRSDTKSLSNKKSSKNDITPIKQKSKSKAIGKMKNMFKSSEKKKTIDMEIGIRLALPDKIGVMRGLEAPSSVQSTNSSSDNPSDGLQDLFPTPNKKLMILPDQSQSSRVFTSLTSPFKKSIKKENKSVEASEPPTTTKEIEKAKETILRSSELDPSVHQTKIPTATEVLIHARVCALLEGYDELLERRAKAGKRWFSFGHLVGMNRLDLKNLYLNAIGKQPEIPLFIGENAHQPPPLPQEPGKLGTCNLGNPFENSSTDLGNPFENSSTDLGSLSSLTISSDSTQGNLKGQKIVKPHPSTVKSLLECADDIIVEGYFTETICCDEKCLEDAETSSVQVAIFSSQRQREFIVCFRGSRLQHSKPLKTKGTINTDPDGVIKCFSDAYSEANLESRVFVLLNKLMTENPFCDVSFIGHSFGGCLATIAAVNCAEKYPMMTVNCHSFGCPKIGKKSFKERAHTLPNLRLFRIEFGSDACVNLPSGSSFDHVGHTIVISSTKEKGSSKKLSSCEKERVEVKAYKFGKRGANQTKGRKSQNKSDHEMRSYLHSIESFTHLGCQWVEKFVGEDGNGIIATNNEERHMV